MRDINPQSKRVKITRWIAEYISYLSDETPWIKAHGMIKKATLTFATNFWWLLA